MSAFYTILLDLSVLAFLGGLYYFFQKRRIIKASTLEIQDSVQEFLYELHSFLEENKTAPFYEELNSFALNLEAAANTNDLGNMEAAVRQTPKDLPKNLQEELDNIGRLF